MKAIGMDLILYHRMVGLHLKRKIIIEQPIIKIGQQ